MAEVAYTKKDKGCYIDGAFGLEHRRQKLWELLEGLLCCGYIKDRDEKKEVLDLLDELKKEPSDDFGEELDAIEILQEHTEEGLIWYQDGDFFLLEEKEIE